MPSYFSLIGFGPAGWGWQLLLAAWMTLSVSGTAFAIGLVCGTAGAAGKLSRSVAARGAGDVYTTVMRGIPDLLVVYLFYFGGSQVLTLGCAVFRPERVLGPEQLHGGGAGDRHRFRGLPDRNDPRRL